MSTLPEKDLPPGRHRLLKEHLMTEFRQETQTDARPARRVWPRPALVAVAAAAVAAGVLVALPSDGTGSRDTAAKRTSDEAVRLLEDIALATAKKDTPDGIRDDRFVYIKSRLGYMHYGMGKKPKLEPVHDREVWNSVDGTREGLLIEDNRNGRMKLEADTPGIPGNTNYRELKKLPTDPDKMYTWLYANREGDNPADEQVFTLFGDLVGESLMPKEQAVALYRAAARIKAVEVVDGVKDAAGRTGVALVREDEDGFQEQQLVFDPRTKEYLGERVVAVRDTGDGLKKGQLLGTSAILDREIVDKAGRRP
ncbi:CU044_5270 family protein [Streptomyces uncialis]|uniref:CU044_5270 family protein n=1 Tax=Streptomyces uncialis TaxID=1048205 RepID=UPI003868C372|nr:CU044_5270 family protein [Streptomyces uncialis]